MYKLWVCSPPFTFFLKKIKIKQKCSNTTQQRKKSPKLAQIKQNHGFAAAVASELN
jgi:hypothetical protein